MIINLRESATLIINYPERDVRDVRDVHMRGETLTDTPETR